MNYQARIIQDGFGSGWPVYELSEPQTDSRFLICPQRGGMVLSFSSHGRELLYLDEQTFVRREMNVRGGIPVLWPICGQLPGGKYEWHGQTYEMPNHGLARRLPWSVVKVETKDRAAITLQLTSSEETRREFPFDFELLFTYELQDGRLIIQQTYGNRSTEAMPMYAGFHPYFRSNHKEISLDSGASSYFDYNDGREHEFTGVLNLADKVESVVLKEGLRSEIRFDLSQDHSPVLSLECSPDFKYLVLWSVQERPFVCVEPWMALATSFAANQGVTAVPAGESLCTYVSLRSLPRGSDGPQ